MPEISKSTTLENYLIIHFTIIRPMKKQTLFIALSITLFIACNQSSPSTDSNANTGTTDIAVNLANEIIKMRADNPFQSWQDFDSQSKTLH